MKPGELEEQTFLIHSQQSQAQEEKGSLLKSQRYQMLIIGIIAMYSEIQRSFFTSFFPIYWSNKNPSPSSQGFPQWMINIPELSILILFKFQNHLLTLFGQKNYILLGLLICFIANLFLGCLELPSSTDTIQYIGLQARMIQGFGINMMQTAAISLVCILFNTDKQRHMSVIQSAIGTGEVVGPFIGSTFFHTLGFPLSFGALNVMIMFMLLSFNRQIPEAEHGDEHSFGEWSQRHVEQIDSNLFKDRSIFMDFFIVAVNIMLDWCYISYFSINMLKLNLTSQQIGQLFLVRAVTYILSCIVIPWLKITPKLSHMLGIIFQCVSITMKCSNNLVNENHALYMVIGGLMLQGQIIILGIASPLVMISAIPNIIERYQYVHGISPTRHPKAYMKLCDIVSNITELMLSLFQVIGSFSGNYFSSKYGYQNAMEGYILIGTCSMFVYGVFGCGVNYEKDHQQIQKTLHSDLA